MSQALRIACRYPSDDIYSAYSGRHPLNSAPQDRAFPPTPYVFLRIADSTPRLLL